MLWQHQVLLMVTRHIYRVTTLSAICIPSGFVHMRYYTPTLGCYATSMSWIEDVENKILMQSGLSGNEVGPWCASPAFERHACCKNGLGWLGHWRGFDSALGSVYTGPDSFGTGTKLVRISFVFTQDLVDTVRIGYAILYQMDPLMKMILCGTVPFQFRTGPV